MASLPELLGERPDLRAGTAAARAGDVVPRLRPGARVSPLGPRWLVIVAVILGLLVVATIAQGHYGAPARVDHAVHYHFGRGTLGAKALRVARCESGFNPRAISPAGRYRGLFQFDRSTWKANGGRGDPVRATPVEQARVARVTWRRRGWSPWPICGRR